MEDNEYRRQRVEKIPPSGYKMVDHTQSRDSYQDGEGQGYNAEGTVSERPRRRKKKKHRHHANHHGHSDERLEPETGTKLSISTGTSKKLAPLNTESLAPVPTGTYNPLDRRMRMEKDRLSHLYAQPEEKQVDVVLVRPADPDGTIKEKHVRKRQLFEKLMREEGIHLEDVTLPPEGGEDACVYTKLHASFKRLCKEAESVKIELPLDNLQIFDDDEGCCGSLQDCFKTDTEVDFVSAPFEMSKLHLFENHNRPDDFLRPSLRSLLTHHILINLDLRLADKKRFDYLNHNNKLDNEEDDRLAKQGLAYLLHKKVYTDVFSIHEPSERDRAEDGKEEDDETVKQAFRKKVAAGHLSDPRKDLDNTWPKVFKFLPLWKIRNYFGEEIAFYFAWSGTLVATLMIPVLLGLAIFGFGLYKSANDREDMDMNTTTTAAVVVTTVSSSTLSELKGGAEQLLAVIKRSFDNDATPWFALVICIWGTIFLEVWKRKNAELAYEWDVDNFETSEPDRPQFFGTEVSKDPVTQEDVHHYPTHLKMFKYFVSILFFLLMVGIVLAVTLAVIVYRVVLKVNYCQKRGNATEPAWSGGTCLVVQTLGSTVLNAIAIMLLGKFYEVLVYKLNDWENHRTQTAYQDALIAKLFFFQFVNSYTSLFYIAFFREKSDLFGTNGLAGLGREYKDSCEGDCMSMLSLQVLVLIVAKPIPKFVKDVILPWLKKLWRKRKCFRGENNVGVVGGEQPEPLSDEDAYLYRESHKPPLQDFTLPEYTEKVIQYGYLMLFAVAMPLAPLIVFLTNIVDRYTDAKRMLWVYRRPFGFITQDIGMWFNILRFINICAVITNGFLIAYTSYWGRENLKTEGHQLWFVLGFENVVFGMQLLVDLLIPDVPVGISLAIRREKFSIQKKMEGALTQPHSLDGIMDVGNMMATFSHCGENTTRKRPMNRDVPDGGSAPDIAFPNSPEEKSGNNGLKSPNRSSQITVGADVIHSNAAFQGDNDNNSNSALSHQYPLPTELLYSK